MAYCEQVEQIPMPIVKLNRWIIVSAVGLGLVLQQPLLTTALVIMLIPAVVWGRRASLVYQVGRRLLTRQNTQALARAEYEDPRLTRFNNTLALIGLGLAQLSFVAGAPAVGWGIALGVATAAAVALAGYCVGCVLFYQFSRLQRLR